MARRSVRSNTAEAIIETAERLFGLCGTEGVSLREISAAAGCANTAAVQYHFGDKDGLIAAIFAHRLPVIDRRRAEMLSAIGDDRPGDLRVLIALLYRPLFEQQDSLGRRSFVAFLAGLWRFQRSFAVRNRYSALAPAGSRVLGLLKQAVPHLPRPVFQNRIEVILALLMNAIVDFDLAKADGATALADDAFIADMIEMANGALLAPLAQPGIHY